MLDWKQISQSPGYKSMKKAVADEAKRTAKWKRKPDERYMESFNFAIARAKHYSHHTGKSVEYILNEWEERRDYNFISFYSNHHLPKLFEEKFKPWGLNKEIKNARERRYYNSGKNDESERIRSIINCSRERNAIKNPARWKQARKIRMKRIREIESHKKSV